MTVEDTLKSIISQDYPCIDYIIIDGGSTDGTKDVIKKYVSKISTFISEKDKGIFDAMNKSLSYVKGDYVLFMNAGDKFVNQHIVSDVFVDDNDDADIIYGDTFIETKYGFKLNIANAIYKNNPLPKDLVFQSQGICHQSIFTKTEILKKIKFNIEYPIGADYDTTAQIYFAGNHRLRYVGFPISVFDDRFGGASHYKEIQLYNERFKMFNYRPTIFDLLKVRKFYIYNKIKFMLELIFPTIVGKYRARKYTKTI